MYNAVNGRNLWYKTNETESKDERGNTDTDWTERTGTGI